MRIAIIGWGSLIWCPGNLRIRTRWRSDGPTLPIEFARISRDGRLTLVIHDGAEPQQTYWALSAFDDLEAAKRNLKERERANSKDIHYFTLDGRSPNSVPPKISQRIQAWLVGRKDVDAAVWTGLSTNWPDKRNQEVFTVDDALEYVRGLLSEGDRLRDLCDRVQDYVCNTPAQIQTVVRKRLRERGWQDAELAKVLFEETGE
jgi:hypothetical protein